MRRLTVLYDQDCGICQRARAWLELQPKYVPLEFVPAVEAAGRFPSLETESLLGELTVVSDRGAVWRGAKAWVTVLWALREYRGWSLRLARPRNLRYARGVVSSVSQNRHRLSKWLGLRPLDVRLPR